MATKVISFLGYTPPDKPYRETMYCFEGKECTTPFMAEATAQFFMPDEMLVLVTKESRTQNFAHFAERVGSLFTIQPVDIPSGKHEDELWEMFTIMSQKIEAGDSIIFDITNGFRSLPVLAFLAASYIRVVRQATVSRMIYGAFDATVEGRTPVFDLTPFVRLLDWTTATDAFIKSGRGTELANLLRQSTTNSAQLKPSHAFQDMADKLEVLTSALQTVRPSEVMQSANGLETDIETTRQEDVPSIQPFSLLLDRINDEYSPFALEKPKAKVSAQQVIGKQLLMIEWYMSKGLLIQAVTLAREWLVSWVVVEVGGDVYRRRHRQDAEGILNGYGSSINTKEIQEWSTIVRIWRSTTQLRNDLDHAGMNENPRTARDVLKQANTMYSQLKTLWKG